MRILSVKTRVQDLNRLRKIVTVLFEAGFGFLIDRVRLKYLVPSRLRLRHWLGAGKKRAIKSPEVRLRESFEKLGPTFIKLGQILSLRPDLIPAEYAKELEKLQSKAQPFPYEEAERIVKEELGKPIKTLFREFEKMPFAAASLSQVHRAVLKDGAEAAVKVQRPRIEKEIQNDVHILLFLAALLEKYMPEARVLRPVQLVKEFEQWTMRELDFRVEATNAERFRYNMKEEPGISIPRVHWDLTSRRVLAMEFVHGVTIDDEKGLAKIGAVKKTLAERGVRALLHQFLRDGFFHADPHPGNFFILKNNTLCFHDFGMVGYVSPKQRSELVSYFVSFLNRDMENSLKHLLDMAEVGEGSDVDGFKQEVSAILGLWFYAPVKESITSSFMKALGAAVKHRIVFPSNLVLLGKAMFTTEAMARRFYPKFDFYKEFEPYLETVFRSAFDLKEAAKNTRDNMFDYLTFFKTLPEHTLALIERLEKGDIGVKINVKELVDFKEEIDRQNDVKILAGLTVVVTLTSAVILSIEEAYVFGISLGKLGLGISFLLLIWLVILVRKK